MTSKHIDLGLLVEAEQLCPYLAHPQLRIIDLCRSSVYTQLHLPDAIHLRPSALVQAQEKAMGMLPDLEAMQQLIEQLNLAPDQHVVVYDDEGGGWASRLIWNLHCYGFEHTSLINGGLHACLAARLPMTAEVTPQVAVAELYRPEPSAMQQYRIRYAELREQIPAQALQLWDCRTREEYTGQRLAARRGGHIPGAQHFEWSTALDLKNHLKLHPLADIQQRLAQLGFNLQQPVVVYCQSHHRSSLAYIIARLLGWQVLAYDGAWSEWGNRPDSPIVSGETPF